MTTRFWRTVAASPAARTAGRRLLIAIPVIWLVTFMTALLLDLLPGNAATQILGADASPGQIQALTAQLHLNEPFIVRYWDWLVNVVRGNLGTSIASGQTVTSIIGQRLPVTLELVGYAFVITIVLSVPLALAAARRPHGIVDRVSMLISMGGLSIAPYCLALVLVIAFAAKLRVFPAIGWSPVSAGLGSNLDYLTLPALAIALPLACLYTRLLRADLIEQMEGEGYVLTARAKGLGTWHILVSHALRNSLIGLLTLIGLNIATLIGSTVIVEQIYSLPGIGQELLNAINNRDLPVVEGLDLIFALAVVVANVITDLLYTVLDPRIQHGRATS